MELKLVPEKMLANTDCSLRYTINMETRFLFFPAIEKAFRDFNSILMKLGCNTRSQCVHNDHAHTHTHAHTHYY